MRLTKFLKRQVSKVLCAALVLSSVAVAGERQVAEAASKTEIETYGTVLTLNETATGVLAKEDEQDWYIFDITEQGYFSVDLQINDDADITKINNGWKYSLYHAEDWINSVYSIKNIKTNEAGKGRKLPLSKGRYYICVERDDYYSQPIDCLYDVRVNFTLAENWEQEDNDTNAEPNAIEVNKTYLGNFHKSSDIDWYVVETPEDGILQLDFGPDVSTDGDEIAEGWKITILDEEQNVITKYTTRVKLTPQVLPFAKGTFYIRVESENYYGQPLYCIYNLQMKFTPTTDWEEEYNGEYALANTITSGNEYHGVLSWEDDEDWYRINNETDATGTLQFRVDESVSVDDIGDGWKIIVYNEEREQIVELKDVKTKTIEENIRMTKGASYIKVVRNGYYNRPIDCIYHLTVTTTPLKAPDTTSNPSETPNNTSTPDNTSKPNNTSKPDNTSKPNTTNQPNSASNEAIQKAITTSKVTTSIVTSKKKKSVYLRWKKQKYAGGYEIYRSTKKKKGYKKVKTIKGGSKVSWTDKKVKGGKTYYYKIRAYRKIKGKKAVSGFSKVKRVKVKK